MDAFVNNDRGNVCGVYNDEFCDKYNCDYAFEECSAGLDRARVRECEVCSKGGYGFAFLMLVCLVGVWVEYGVE